MEMIVIPYEQMHDIVVTVMKERGSFEQSYEGPLLVIGKWYQQCTLSGIDEIALKVPFYTKDLLPSLIEYHYWMDLLIKLSDIRQAKELDQHVLFDIKGYLAADKYNRKNNDFAITYQGSRSRVHCFEHGIRVSAERFLPLFPPEQLSGRNAIICDLFCLLSVLGRANMIPFPVIFDLNKDLTLFIKQTQQYLEPKAFSKMLFTEDFRNDHDKRDVILDDLSGVEIKRCISFTYPYHVEVSSSVLNEFRGRTKLFRIELFNRFYHDEIDDEELILTKQELAMGTGSDILTVIDQFHIIDTNCGPELISALRDLKYDWNTARFNVFTNPFPVKWLLCIHHGRDINFWREQFKKDYPEIKGKLLTDIFLIVDLVYELNWIDKFLLSDLLGTLLLPKLTIHSETILTLKEHLSKHFKHITFSDEIDKALDSTGSIYLLDPFNVVLLNNISLKQEARSFQIIVPDFLYYTYQPFVRYLAVKYHADALTGGIRERIDPSYQNNLEEWHRETEILKQDSRKALHAFNKNRSIKDQETNSAEDLRIEQEPSPSELLEQVAAKERKINKRVQLFRVEVNTFSKKRMALRSDTPVLIKANGSLIRTIAGVLETDTLFIPLEEVINNLDLKNMIDRLVTLSEAAKNWHKDLKTLDINEGGIFDGLKNVGLSISKITFEKDYLSVSENAGDLHMPRAKNDWKIICQRLQIEDRQTAWNAVKCREDLNQLKAVYLKILELMIDTGSFGINVSDVVLEKITALLTMLPDAGMNAKENKKDAIGLVIEICDKISLEKIENINFLNLSV